MSKEETITKIVEILHQINDNERFIKIYTVAKTHLALEHEKGGADNGR